MRIVVFPSPVRGIWSYKAPFFFPSLFFKDTDTYRYTHAHIFRPSQSHGLRGTWNPSRPSTIAQCYSCELYVWEFAAATMLGKFTMQKIPLDHPSFAVGNPFAHWFYTSIHSPPFVMQSLLEKNSNMESSLFIFQNVFYFLRQCVPIIVLQGCLSNNWTWHTVSHHLGLLKLIWSQWTSRQRPFKIPWAMTELNQKNYKRIFTDTNRFRSVSLCWWNFIQPIGDRTPML